MKLTSSVSKSNGFRGGGGGCGSPASIFELFIRIKCRLKSSELRTVKFRLKYVDIFVSCLNRD